MNFLRIVVFAGVIVALIVLAPARPAQAASAAEKGAVSNAAAIAWDVISEKKPAPEKPPRPRPAPGPRDGGEDE